MAKPSDQSKGSKLLTSQQNKELFDIMGPSCKSRVTALVRVHKTKPPNHSEWHMWCYGAATFTKDYSRRSFYIQIYDLAQRTRVFEQEITDDFAYNAESHFFHQFECDTFVIGLEFVDAMPEAANLKVAIEKHLRTKKLKDDTAPNDDRKLPPPYQPLQHAPQTHDTRSESNGSHKQNQARPKHGKKAESSNAQPPPPPTDDEMLAHIMESLAILPEELEHPNAKVALLQDIDQNGGLWKIFTQLKSAKGKRGPTPPLPPPPNYLSSEPSGSTLPPPPPPPSSTKPSSHLPGKIVTANPPVAKPIQKSTESNSHSNLLSQIRNPKLQLKPVDKNKPIMKKMPSMLSQFAGILAKRNEAIGGSESSGSDSFGSDGDDDWIG